MKKKSKPGPEPWGLGPLFSVRLTEDQHKRVLRLMKNTGESRGHIIRELLARAI